MCPSPTDAAYESSESTGTERVWRSFGPPRVPVPDASIGKAELSVWLS